MSDYTEGLIEGLGIAIFLAERQKNPRKLLSDLTHTTQQIQLIKAAKCLDNIKVEIGYQNSATQKQIK